MKRFFFQVIAVVAVTVFSVLLIPGVDDAVELVFQLMVMLASS